jgi:hypothetical protein
MYYTITMLSFEKEYVKDLLARWAEKWRFPLWCVEADGK